MSAADRYYQVERQVMVGRARGTLTEAGEDELLEESDDLWLQMTMEERAEADARVEGYIALQAPEVLGLLDTAVPIGQGDAPRRAA